MKTDTGTIIMYTDESDEATICTMSDKEEKKLEEYRNCTDKIKRIRKREYSIPKRFLKFVVENNPEETEEK